MHLMNPPLVLASLTDATAAALYRLLQHHQSSSVSELQVRINSMKMSPPSLDGQHHRSPKLCLPSASPPLFSPSDIQLTHNCGSPPPITGINPHLRPPRQTVCSPTMHLSFKTFPDTFGLLLVTILLSLPVQSNFFQAFSPWPFIAYFHLLCFFLKL